MADANVDLVRRGLEAFNRGDIDAIFRMLDEDVEVFSHPDTGNTGTYHGHRRRARDRDHRPDGAGPGKRDRGPAEGRRLPFTVRGGRAVFMGLYLDRATALADLRQR